MPQVVAAEPALDVRNRRSQQPAHRRAENRRHRVAVDEDERGAGAVHEPRLSGRRLRANRPSDGGEPARHVPVRPQVAAIRAAAEPEVRLRQAELLEQRRDLLDLLRVVALT